MARPDHGSAWPEPDLATLTSLRSPRVAAVRRLHRRAVRLAEGRFIVEGPQAVREALAAGGLLELYVCNAPPELEVLARTAAVPVTPVSGPVMAAMAETAAPQGVLGIAPLLDIALDQVPDSARLVVVLDRVNDPGNAGTVLRTADAAGADAVVLTAGSVDPHNGKCVRAAAGSLWHLPVVTGPPMETVVSFLRSRRMQVLATTGAGDSDLDDLIDGSALSTPTAWLFGTEAHGLGTDVLAAADHRVRITLRGRAESLNLAAAAAICLFASARSHRVMKGQP